MSSTMNGLLHGKMILATQSKTGPNTIGIFIASEDTSIMKEVPNIDLHTKNPWNRITFCHIFHRTVYVMATLTLTVAKNLEWILF